VTAERLVYTLSVFLNFTFIRLNSDKIITMVRFVCNRRKYQNLLFCNISFLTRKFEIYIAAYADLDVSFDLLRIKIKDFGPLIINIKSKNVKENTLDLHKRLKRLSYLIIQINIGKVSTYSTVQCSKAVFFSFPISSLFLR
jgi:hypothetical protein